MKCFTPENTLHKRTEQVASNIATWQGYFQKKYLQNNALDLEKEVAADFRWFGTVGNECCFLTKDGKKRFWSVPVQLLQAIPDLTVKHYTFGEGAMVGGHFVFEGTHSGYYFDVPPTGNKVRFFGNAIARFDPDGMIVEERELLDEVVLLKQLGVIEDTGPETLITTLRKYSGRHLVPSNSPGKLPEVSSLLYQLADSEPENRDPKVVRNMVNWRKLTAKKYHERDFDTLDEVLSPDYQWQGAMGVTFCMDSLEKKQALLHSFDTSNQCLQDLKFYSHTFGEGDMVVYNIVSEATHIKEIEDVPATHRPLRFVNISIGRFDEQGRLEEEIEIIDFLAMHTQMGVIPNNLNNLTLLDVLRNLDTQPINPIND